MPSRPVTALIVLFWLCGVGWLAYREVLSRLGTEEPPPIHFDLADDVSSRIITWKIYQKDVVIGSAKSTIQRGERRTFLLTCDHVFRNFKPLAIGEIEKVSSSYRVTAEGDLLEVSTSVKSKFGNLVKLDGVRGTITAGILRTEPFGDGWLAASGAQGLLKQEVEVPPGTVVLNTMHPLHKITGLWEGRRWKVPVFNPIKLDLAVLTPEMPSPIAQVVSDAIEWQGAEVPCWRIDYTDTKKGNAIGHTWVRKADGLVLKQDASFQGIQLTLERESLR